MPKKLTGNNKKPKGGTSTKYPGFVDRFTGGRSKKRKSSPAGLKAAQEIDVRQ